MKFTYDWFTQAGCPTLWPKFIGHLAGKPNVTALEIGSFEGRSTVWLLENILTGEGSSIFCIDTFQGGEEHGELNLDPASIRNHFIENTAENRDRVLMLEGRSDYWLPSIQGVEMNLVYIDGSHRSHDVLMDACLSWPLLVPGGTMIFDDYGWHKYSDESRNPKLGIDAFLSVVGDRCEILHKEYQVICRKK